MRLISAVLPSFPNYSAHKLDSFHNEGRNVRFLLTTPQSYAVSHPSETTPAPYWQTASHPVDSTDVASQDAYRQPFHHSSACLCPSTSPHRGLKFVFIDRGAKSVSVSCTQAIAGHSGGFTCKCMSALRLRLTDKDQACIVSCGACASDFGCLEDRRIINLCADFADTMNTMDGI